MSSTLTREKLQHPYPGNNPLPVIQRMEQMCSKWLIKLNVNKADVGVVIQRMYWQYPDMTEDYKEGENKVLDKFEYMIGISCSS